MRPGAGQGLLNPQVRDEAAQWFIAFCEEEVDSGTCQQFYDWLRRSPEHVRAYLRISAFWEDAGDLSKHTRHGADEIVKRALAESNVVALDETLKGRSSSRVPKRRGALLIACAASCLGVTLLIGLLLNRAPSVYSTASGERRSLTLTDGSTVELNARSRIRIDYSSTARDVALLEGQALFKVARDPSRPFVVHGDGASVRAVGTQFDVNRSHGSMIVTVVEGRVAVTNDGANTKEPSAEPAASSVVLVTAGERVVARARTLNPPQPVNATAATAWTEGKLVFESVPLQEVLEEFNRYRPKPLVVADPQLLGMHISGVFSVDESPQFVEFLQQRFGTSAREAADATYISRP